MVRLVSELGLGLDLGLHFYWNLSWTVTKTSTVSFVNFHRKQQLASIMTMVHMLWVNNKYKRNNPLT